MKQTMVSQFFQQVPSEDACLEHLFNVRFRQGHTCPKCEHDARWYRRTSEQAYSCQWCGHHIHPMVGSIFETTRTPLQLWFYAIFLFNASKRRVSGKELQRQLGVTYKTTRRMANLIREHMAEIDGKAPLGGAGRVVKVDEIVLDRKPKGMNWRKVKTVVMGMMERDSDVMLKVVDDQTRGQLVSHINNDVAHGTKVQTDT